MKPLLLRLAIFAAAALAGPAQSGEPHWPDHLTIGTASPGGTYYVYGEGLARILEELIEVHAAAAATVPANIVRNTFLPFHPGAIRYYRQIGIAGLGD